MSAPTKGFAGYAYHDETGDPVYTGTITADRWRLLFSSAEMTIEIPLVRLEIEPGEPTDRRVYFRHSDQAGWTVYTFEESILRHPAFREQTHTRLQIEQIRSAGELKRRLKLVGWFMAGFAGLSMLVWIGSGIMVRSIVSRIPPSVEKELGDNVLDEIRTEQAFAADPKRLTALTNAVAPLLSALPASPYAYSFYILEEPLPNAFALPGGHVIVTTGLMELVEGPDELAAVAAHEIAHVLQRHLFRKVISSAGPYLLVRVYMGDQGGLLGLLGASSELLVRQSFSQEYELEADAVGWDYMARAGLDPRALPRVLRKLEAAQAQYRPGLEIQAFSTHPETEKRIRRLEQKWDSIKDKRAFTPKGNQAEAP